MNIGMLYPGDMGITLSIALQEAGHKIMWPSICRSDETKSKATAHNIEDVVGIDTLLKECSVVFVICKNGGPLEIADIICNHNYKGIVCDANNLWGEKSEIDLSDKYFNAGVRYVDASLWGWPHNVGQDFSQDRTMYLYGKDAEAIKSLFIDDYWKIEILDRSAKAHKRYLTEQISMENV